MSIKYNINEDRKLRACYACGMSNKSIAEVLGRTERSVSRRITRLGIRTAEIEAKRRKDASSRAWHNFSDEEKTQRMTEIARKKRRVVNEANIAFYKKLRSQNYTKAEALAFIKELERN